MARVVKTDNADVDGHDDGADTVLNMRMPRWGEDAEMMTRWVSEEMMTRRVSEHFIRLSAS